MISGNAGGLFENYLSPRADPSLKLRLDESIVKRTHSKIEKTRNYLLKMNFDNIDMLQTIKTDIFGDATLAVIAKLESKYIPAFRVELTQRIKSERLNAQSFDSLGSLDDDRQLGSSPNSLSAKLGIMSNNRLYAKIIDTNKV